MLLVLWETKEQFYYSIRFSYMALYLSTNEFMRRTLSFSLLRRLRQEVE